MLITISFFACAPHNAAIMDPNGGADAAPAVFLGVCDLPLPQAAEVAEGWWTNKVGGCAVWPTGKAPSVAALQCQCGAAMVLVLQVRTPSPPSYTSIVALPA